ncbi:hypothetical protein [Oscillatoria acuminata]|nr:hypothetical protein [Oscillatoria acuminata]
MTSVSWLLCPVLPFHSGTEYRFCLEESRHKGWNDFYMLADF